MVTQWRRAITKEYNFQKAQLWKSQKSQNSYTLNLQEF